MWFRASRLLQRRMNSARKDPIVIKMVGNTAPDVADANLREQIEQLRNLVHPNIITCVFCDGCNYVDGVQHDGVCDQVADGTDHACAGGDGAGQHARLSASRLLPSVEPDKTAISLLL